MKQIEQVKEFMTSFGQKVSDKPRIGEFVDFDLRKNLMNEENEEYFDACISGDMVGIADALGDKLYILLGTILHHGMQDKIESVFDEIHRSNMSKLGEDGKPIYRSDGKVKKGPGFYEPRLCDIINGID